MYRYPKQILTIEQQIQSYIDAGMEIESYDQVEDALRTIGYYRLRGYSFQLYNNDSKKYVVGTKFENILQLYQFDQKLSNLIFSMISKIEVALRVRLVEALLIHNDVLILQDSSIFKDKKMYWRICRRYHRKLQDRMMYSLNIILRIMKARYQYGQL